MDFICNRRSHLVWPCAPLWPPRLPPACHGCLFPTAKPGWLLLLLHWRLKHASLHLPRDLHCLFSFYLASPWSSRLAASCHSDISCKQHLTRAFPDAPVTPYLTHSTSSYFHSQQSTRHYLIFFLLTYLSVSLLECIFPLEECPSYSLFKKLPQTHPLQLLIII